MTFNTKNWSIKQAIIDRVQRESLTEWGQDTTLPPKPRYEVRTGPKRHVNWQVFFLTAVRSFRP